MKNKIIGVFLVVFMLLLGFCAGAIVGGQLVPKSEGLAGAAEVLGYGIIGAILFLLLGIAMVRKMEARQKQIALIIVVVLSLGVYGILHYRYLEKQKEREDGDIRPTPTQTTPPVDN